MKCFGCVLAILLFALQPPAGKVASEYDKKADFTTYRTYTRVAGIEAYGPVAHKLVVEGIEREMAALGFTKDDSGGADVTITYHSVRTANIDLKDIEKVERMGNKESAPVKDMGKLLIVLREARTSRQLWAANTMEYLSPDLAVREETIRSAVTRIFETYPTRRK